MNTELLRSELSKVWPNDTRMIDHCLKSNAYVQIDDFFVSIGDKSPKFESIIYYDDERPSPVVTEEYFIDYNLKHRFKKDTSFFICRSYKSKDANLYCLAGKNYPVAIACTEDQNNLIRQEIDKLKEYYIKRLKNYYKRYNSKIRTYGYYANR